LINNRTLPGSNPSLLLGFGINIQKVGKIVNEEKEIRIMIVGDFLIFRNGLKLLLETEKKNKFVGEAADLAEAAHLIPRNKPNLLLIDCAEIDHGDFDSFLALHPQQISTIVLSDSRDTEKLKQYLLLGVDGLVSKEQTADALFKAIDCVNEGGVWFDRKLLSDVIKQLVKEKKLLPERLYSFNCADLTEREREVLKLICKGMKNKLIADSLFITETTVRHHLTSIFEKLKVSSRLELVVYAFKENLVEVPLHEIKALSDK
jgi:DNA-binding NarL/FixJ family response regulator